MRQLKVINLFGGPGSGKSTLAAGVFHALKLKGYNVELVTEYAKDLTWDQRNNALRDQLYVLAKQHARLMRLEGQVDLAITDSPLLLAGVYVKGHRYYDNTTFHALVRDLHFRFYSQSFFVERVKPYSPVGRGQTEEEADRLSKDIKGLLFHHMCLFNVVEGSEGGTREVAARAAGWLDTEKDWRVSH